MPDYKEMYFKLFRATEQSITILLKAQQECEELYINAPEPDLNVISIHSKSNKRMELK